MISGNSLIRDQLLNTNIIERISLILNKRKIRTSEYGACIQLLLKLLSTYPKIQLSGSNYQSVSPA